jgi:hypothetical protein
MKKEELVDLLKEKYGYPQAGAVLVADKLSKFQRETRQAFEVYLETEAKPDISVEGFDFDRLTSQYEMNPIAAFLTLDWLLREPEKAVESLQRGYDTISKQ